MSSTLLEVKNLSVFSSKNRVLNNVNLVLPSGRITAVLGETGSGKTMLAKCISGMLPLNLTSEGSILYYSNGAVIDIKALSPKEMNKIRGREILVIPQTSGSALNPLIRIEKQFMLPLRKRLKLSYEEARVRMMDKLELLDLKPEDKILKLYPHELSGGMKVRLMLAIGLAMNSRLLILDEPTKGLDGERCCRLMELIEEELAATGLTVLLISHDLDLIERYAEQAGVLYKGEIVDSGGVDEVLGKKAKPYVQALRMAQPVHGMEVRELDA